MRAKIIVYGKVQGVFFRNFAKLEAEKLGIMGYAKNLKDGTVEIIAEGDEKALEHYKKQLWKGPTMAFVKNVEQSATDITEEFEGFDIR
jgi:acylphosphatase